MLTVDAAKTIASAIVGARLDYCNRLLQGTSDYNFDRLQRIQNRLAHVVLPFSAGANEARHELHWLLIRQRNTITFKLATMTYKAGRSGRNSRRIFPTASITITKKSTISFSLITAPTTSVLFSCLAGRGTQCVEFSAQTHSLS